MNVLFLIVFPLVLGLYAQMRVSSAYEKNKRIRSRSGISGMQAARFVMEAAGINDVEIVEIGGHLTDHYDPINKRLALSSENYRGTSLAALGVSAHEAGHAIQHKQGYKPLKARMALIPVTNFASQLLPIVMLGGFFLLNSFLVIYIGIFIYLVLTIFQFVTLPVEFNASSRAKKYLEGLNIITRDERRGVEETLNAAAFTYVAAFVTSLMWLLYLLSRRN